MTVGIKNNPKHQRLSKELFEMATVGKVITQTGNAESISPRKPAQYDPASATSFDSSLNQDVALVGRDAPQRELPEPAEEFWSETARRRTVEELRTLMRAIQSASPIRSNSPTSSFTREIRT